MNKDALARRRIAVQSWFVGFAALILISIIYLQQFRGVVAPDPSIPSTAGIISSVALALGVLGLLVLFIRRRNAAIYRFAGSLPASLLVLAAVLAYAGWIFAQFLGWIQAAGR